MKKSVLLLQNTEAGASANQNVIEKIYLCFLFLSKYLWNIKINSGQTFIASYKADTIFKFSFIRSVSQSFRIRKFSFQS